MGGIGAERDISIRSGNCIARALKKTGLNVVTADIRPESLDILDDASIDVFFPALHGEFGEDGQLQGILERKALVYTGSGPEASRLAFDKLAGKRCFAKAGITTPGVIEFAPGIKRKELEEQLLSLGGKFVVKPVRQGSTIGVTIVDDPKSAIAAARSCWNKFGNCMVEEFIAGREITVGILEGRALPIIEIKTKTGFYDYQAKYLDEQTEFLFDTIKDQVLVAKIKQTALDCFGALGLRHFARVDLILGQDGKVYALEVNNIPGFTERSDLPKAAEKAGISMSQLCLRIVEAALKEAENLELKTQS